jgi:bifunctional non-homologous end joining protein LigD
MTRRTARPMLAEDPDRPIAWGRPGALAPLAACLNDQHIAQEKLDGVRALLHSGADGSRLLGRKGDDHARSFPGLAAITVPGLILDGELTAPRLPGEDRAPFTRISGWFRSGPARAAWYERCYGPAEYHVFDLLALPDPDTGQVMNLAGLPYAARRAALETLLPALAAACPEAGLRLVADLPATADSIAGLLAEGAEGAILKRLDAPYAEGVRSGCWRKVKAAGDIDVVLTGDWRAGEGGRAGTIGSVEIAVYDDAGALLPLGHCAVKPEMAREVAALAASGRLAGTVWRITANGIGLGGKLRHPRMDRARPDKDPRECGLRQLDALPQAA